MAKKKKYELNENGYGVCLCGGKLGWSGDFMADEMGLGDESQVVGIWHCQQCGSDVYFVSPSELEED